MTHFMILIHIIRAKQVFYQIFFSIEFIDDYYNRLTGIVFKINIKKNVVFNLNNMEILYYQPYLISSIKKYSIPTL